MTGHLVLSTLHTNDAASTPIRLIDMGAPGFMVAMSLRMVLAQRLVRMVCDVCRVKYEPKPPEIEWLTSYLKDAVDTTACVHGTGCNQCSGTGYTGRTGVYELLEMNQRLVRAANRGDQEEFAEAARLQMGGNSLGRQAARLALLGRTTVEEAMNVSSQLVD